jgi:transcriptional regulator with XRE-family HTH domain
MGMTALALGEAIKKARKLRGKTQQETADAVGVSRPSLTQWEQDLTNPSIPNLKKLCEFLEIDSGTLLAGSVKPDDRTEPKTSVDEAAIGETLDMVSAVVSRDIGFAPTREQALRWLLKKAGIYDAVFST